MTNPKSIEQLELSEREEIRQKLLKAGLLVTAIELPEAPEGWEDVEDLTPIELPTNSLSIAEMIEEERGKV